MNRLVLIDGNAVLHRAYHAIPPLNAPDGTQVNAVYGFATMLLRHVQELAPSHMAVAFDRPKPTFRKKLYASYQATRPKMEEALVGQIEKVHALVEAFGIPIYEKDGFEADDVIGTLVGKEKKRIDQVIIVTGDRDILQLVEDDHVMVYMPTKGLSEAKLYREKDVRERLGVDPARIPDFKGLAGDASDNYPGVVGIGPKTAIALLDIFDTIENLYKAIDKKDSRLSGFSTVIIEKLINGQENAKLFKDIATIRMDVKITDGLLKHPMTSLDTPDARAMFESLHFHSLLRRLSSGALTGTKSVKESDQKSDKQKSEQQALF